MSVHLTGSHGVWSLPEGPTLIGRSRECAICVVDARLSRRHAVLHVAGSQAEIEDLGSTNGVMLNGDRISGRRDLSDGDALVMGPCTFIVGIDPTSEHTAVVEGKTRDRVNSHTVDAMAITHPMNPLVTPPMMPAAAKTIDPGIAKALSVGAGKKDAHSSTDTLRPSDYRSNEHTAVSPNLLARGKRDDGPASSPAYPPPEVGTDRRGQLLPHDKHETTAALQAVKRPPGSASSLGVEDGVDLRAARLVAGFVDGVLSLGLSLLLSLPIALEGYAWALLRAGAVITDGLPLLPYSDTPPSGFWELAVSPFRAGGLGRALELANHLRFYHDQGPFLILFGSASLATLLFVLTHQLGVVDATVVAGAPPWHRRAGLLVVVHGSQAFPSRWRSFLRWSMLLVLWPAALVAVLLNRRGPHDILAGCEVRLRKRH